MIAADVARRHHRLLLELSHRCDRDAVRSILAGFARRAGRTFVVGGAR